MALMAAHGEITPLPDCAIFADTGWEPKSVYSHLEWLKMTLPFPIYVVSAGDLRTDIKTRSKSATKRIAAVPWHILMPNNDSAIGRRQCTSEYKLRPIQRKIVELMGGRPKYGAEAWIGISVDEAIRCKPSRVQYIVNTWPLLDKQMNRNDCIKWLERNGYQTPPKSACIGCPFHSDHYWRDMKLNRPDEWQNALEIDAAIRNQPKFHGQQFMHRSLKSLAEVDLSTAEDHGQLNLFNNECEGMCGV